MGLSKHMQSNVGFFLYFESWSMSSVPSKPVSFKIGPFAVHQGWIWKNSFIKSKQIGGVEVFQTGRNKAGNDMPVVPKSQDNQDCAWRIFKFIEASEETSHE